MTHVRISSGWAKNLALAVGAGVRPTKNIARQALFNILRPELHGKTFIDLFAGSGAIGIEALANGAERCVFVECANNSLKLLKKNINELRTNSVRQGHEIGEIEIKKMRVENFLRNLNLLQPAIVWADPPYNETHWRATLTSKLTVCKPSRLILELPASTAETPTPHGWKVLKHRRYGNSVIEVLTRE